MSHCLHIKNSIPFEKTVTLFLNFHGQQQIHIIFPIYSYKIQVTLICMEMAWPSIRQLPNTLWPSSTLIWTTETGTIFNTDKVYLCDQQQEATLISMICWISDGILFVHHLRPVQPDHLDPFLDAVHMDLALDPSLWIFYTAGSDAIRNRRKKFCEQIVRTKINWNAECGSSTHYVILKSWSL